MDSKIVLLACIDAKVKDLICFSYGPANNADAHAAKILCRKLEVSWIDCCGLKNFQKDRDNYLQKIEIEQALPMDECIAALKYLQNRFSKTHTILNGQTGDFLTGNHRIDYDSICDDTTYAEYNCKEVFGLSRFDNKNFSLEYILKANSNSEIMPDKIEDFEWRNRQAKYVTSISSTYNFYGFESFLPLWGHNVVEFWRTINKNELHKQIKYIEDIKSIEVNHKLERSKNEQGLYQQNESIFIRIMGKLKQRLKIPILQEVLYIMLFYQSKYAHRIYRKKALGFIKLIGTLDSKKPFGRMCMLSTYQDLIELDRFK